MPRVFISYRRADSIAYAGRIYDRLAAAFGGDQVFMDIDTLDPGVDFVDALHRTVAACDVCLVVIGRGWVGAADDAGQPRLFDPHDFVAHEVASALAKPDVRVVPVLVGGAPMPATADLPDALKALTRRHAVELPDAGFQLALGRLIDAIGTPGGDQAAPAPVMGAAGARGSSPASARRHWRWVWGAGAALVLATTAIALWLRPPPGPADRASAAATPAPSSAGASTATWGEMRLIPIETHHLDIRPDGQAIAAVLLDRDQSSDRIAIVDAATGRTARSMLAPGDVNGVAYAPDGRLVATAGTALRLWDAESGDLVHEFPGRWQAEGVAFAPNGRLLAVGDASRAVVFDVQSRLEYWSSRVERPSVDVVAFSADSAMLGYAGADLDRVRFATFADAAEPTGVPGRQQAAVAFSPDGRWAAIGGLAGDMQLRELPSLRLAHQWPAPADEEASIDTLRFSADSRSLLSLGFAEQRLRTWSIPDGVARGEVALPGKPAVFALSRDGRTLVVGGSPTVTLTAR